MYAWENSLSDTELHTHNRPELDILVLVQWVKQYRQDGTADVMVHVCYRENSRK